MNNNNNWIEADNSQAVYVVPWEHYMVSSVFRTVSPNVTSRRMLGIVEVICWIWQAMMNYLLASPLNACLHSAQPLMHYWASPLSGVLPQIVFHHFNPLSRMAHRYQRQSLNWFCCTFNPKARTQLSSSSAHCKPLGSVFLIIHTQKRSAMLLCILFILPPLVN